MLSLMALTLLSNPAKAIEEEWTGHFFMTDKTYVAMAAKNNVWNVSAAKVPDSKQPVADAVARIAKEELGEKWVQSALKLAKIESNYTCKINGPRTAHGHAKGVFQVIDSSARALGYDPKRLHECDHGIRAGIAHMKRCLEAGVADHRQMAACHVAGWAGWNVKLARRHERYKQQYIQLAMR